jgi:hypothetical protein
LYWLIADAGAGGAGRLCGLPEADKSPILTNRLSGCSIEQGFISSVILIPSLAPPPYTCAAPAPISSHDPVVGSRKSKGGFFLTGITIRIENHIPVFS